MKENKFLRLIKAQILKGINKIYTYYNNTSFPFNLQLPYVLALPYHLLNPYPYHTCVSEAHFPMYWYGRSQKAIRYSSSVAWSKKLTIWKCQPLHCMTILTQQGQQHRTTTFIMKISWCSLLLCLSVVPILISLIWITSY